VQESDFDFDKLPGLVNNDVTTPNQRLVQEEQLLLGDDPGSGVDEEGSGDELPAKSG